MLTPVPALPDVLALRTDFLVILEPVVDALRDPRRLIGAESGELRGEIGSIADPHDVVVASHAGSCGPDFGNVDTDNVTDLEVGRPALFELGLNDVLHRIIDLQRAGDGIITLILGNEDSHDAIAIIGHDGASMEADEARGSVEEGFVDLAGKLPLFGLDEIGRTVDICIEDRRVREAYCVVAQFQVSCSRYDLAIAYRPTYAKGITGVLPDIVGYAHYAPISKLSFYGALYPLDASAFILCSNMVDPAMNFKSVIETF